MNPQALTGSSLFLVVRMLAKYRTSKQYWSKLPALLLFNVIMTPIYLLESLLFFFIPKPKIHSEPIFIIGHWRSGTTYLHYLLARDKQFGYCSNLDVFIPGALILNRWVNRKIVRWHLPETRPMDNVKLNTDSPQEDEFAMMHLNPHSFYHGFVFPRQLEKLFFSYAVFDPCNVSLINTWMKSYYKYIGRLSHHNNGRRLLLKNPVNTTRIKQLTSMFPGAKFIYLRRKPAEVKPSSLRMFKSLIKLNTLQIFDESQLTKQVNLLHATVIKEYERQRQFINPVNLLEVDYEELIASPLATVQKIYQVLELDGYGASLGDFQQFIAEQKHYKPHTYSYSSV